MFGYITVQQKGLGEDELHRFKACYCGLCRSLGKRWGMMSRWTLSNDMTFLSMLLGSLYEPIEEKGSIRCPVHPLKPRAYARSAAADYAADMNLLLAYYKCLDNQKDEHDPAQGAMAKGMEKAVQSIREKYPAKCDRIREMLDAIGRLEKEDSRDVDALCNLSGQMLGEVFAWKNDAWAPILWEIGAGLGRFVYFMDAYEDYEKDLKKKRFNPLQELHRQPDYEAFCLETLTMLAAEATAQFELLPLERDRDILKNVMYSGIWTRYAQLQKKKNKQEKEHPDE
ncbi:MAG: hypothetical protein E7329_09560 [Clostridiales bacterium]|nr:hypothetical protein [Clostridiales bacterium]